MLQGKTVIVTGAAKGIGQAIALAFAKEGANLVVNYRHTPAEETAEAIKQAGASCFMVQADVSDFSQAEHLIKEAKAHFGSVDVLINNAGITRDGLLMRMKEEDFDAVITNNLKSTFNTIRHASPIMLKQRSGAIINISSVTALIGNAGQANYAASKAGILGLTFATARELAPRGVTCNAIAPGFIQTDMTYVLKDEIKESILAAIPLHRFGTGEDVAKAALFLAENTYLTGQVIRVDGGMVMQ